MRFTAMVAVALIPVFGLLWLCVLVAGTVWALPVALVLLVVAFCGDVLVDRVSHRSSLERFEERERRRAA